MSPPAGHPRRTGRGLALVVLVAALLTAFLLFDTHPTGSWEGKRVLVPKGSPLPEVVRILREGGILPHPLAFRALVLLTFSGRRLHYGEYVFPTSPSAFEAWRRLIRGDVIKYEVTVPPGANLYDVAKLLEEKKLATAEAFLATTASPAVLRRLEIPGESAEGYLFPDSYTFVKPVTPEEILEFMVRQFHRKAPPDAEKRAKEEDLSLHQVVTIASIIEKETGVEEEKPIVSAVIRRRLALGMPLQMDPTVIYGVKRFDGTVTRKDLRTAGPYNTYLNQGLPPGPIANPGLAALAAALNPSKAEYLYFVSKNDGSHTFSRTLPEHNRAVERFRRAVREDEE
ncbi:endolytic transglycosylase MltG [Candidatus Deferrimicrobium sp.]|uniref:endolytic transglycosylase MltG n=1 Tax=Candidatus Deferrimicrobium sp. TaxID=3060586 RepID=UPI00271E4040|nr:endolytic transglycosylase MltG [Candidatus Deferrimicrobium sp.]MDO8739802.1 endolytic transglycosylase MltG [Candidatus Deferrimicrobium sp.]